MIDQALSRRNLLKSGVIMSTAGLLAACSSNSGSTAVTSGASGGTGSGGTADITAGWSTASGGTAPLWIGVDQGIFAKYGLKVNPVESGSSVGATAVVAGQAQVYYGEATSAFQAAAQGQPAEIVATFRDYGIFKFIGSKDIKTAADLAGKPIAISSVGDSTDLSTRNALAQLGVSVNSVTLLPTGTSSARLAALLTGKVAATLLTEPSASKSIGQGCHLLVDQTKVLFIGSAVIISKSFGQQNPGTVVSFLKGMVESVKFYNDPANKQKVIDTFAKYFVLKPSDPTLLANYKLYSPSGALSQDPYPNAAGAQAIIAALKSEDPSRFGKLTVPDVYNYTFAEKLRSSGFLTGVWGSQLNASATPS